MTKYGAALSKHPDSARAIGEVLAESLATVGASPDLAVVFFTKSHLENSKEILHSINEILQPAVLLGASASSVLCGSIEAENQPAIALWTTSSCPVSPMRIEAEKSSDGWAIHGLDTDAEGTLLLLSDPGFPCHVLLKNNPHLTIVGGLASAGGLPGDNRLLLNSSVYHDGAVGALLGLSTRISTVVSQGCRPIGVPFTVTKSQDNLIFEMGGRSAVQRLRETLLSLEPSERALVGKGLHMGIVIDEHKSRFDRGDFLIRSLIGADEKAGVLAVGDTVEIGTTVQFQVRDAASAHEDFQALMASAQGSAALVFTCNGRGTHLFAEPNHDATVVCNALTDAKVAGMFCGGEIGPVADQNFLHGFTASVVLFR